MGAPVDIYTRSSRAGEGSSSHEQQEQEARAFARSRGLIIGRVVRDETKSSSATLDRPMLQEALRRVRSGESEGVVVAYLSRASRDTRQGLELLETITRAGGTVYAPNLPDYTTADGRMLTTIQFAIDTGYRDRKGEELERRKRESIENGIPVHTRPAVGYRANDRHLEPHPRTAPIVRAVFERRAQGEGPTALAQYLESHGVKTSQGSRTWSKQAIDGLIKNEVYMGVLTYGRDKRYINPNGVEDPIVDAALWHAAQHPNGHQLPPARSGESTWLVSGILRCQACRYCMQGTTTSRQKRIYRCNRRHAGGICPAPARIDADAIETAAAAAFWRLTDDIEATGVADTTGEIAGLESALERADRLLAQLDGADAQDALGGSYLTVFRQRREERDQAATELGRARASATTATLPSAETLRGAWKRMSIQDRRELLGLRFHCLALSRDRTLVVYPVGADVGDLPRRGFKRAPVLEPFPGCPDGARTLTL